MFVARPEQGRTVSGTQRVRLGDTDPSGALRLDTAVRYLQDIATDDWDSSGIDSDAFWVVRRTTLRLVDGGAWPRLGDMVTLVTWCAGSGAAWAERRTDLEVDGRVVVEGMALWVPLDRSFRPRRIDDAFRAVYGQAAGGRKVPGRVPTAEVAESAAHRPWPLRRVDLDVAGHVNNAACWTPVAELVADAGSTVAEADLIHQDSVEWGTPVTLAAVPGACWLLQDGQVAVSASWR